MSGSSIDLFSPDDEHYEYSMVATNMTLGVQALRVFMAGRGGHEKTLGELKQHLAFGTVPTQDWDANGARQQLSALTHNLVCNFQVRTGAVPRPNTRKRTCRYRFLSPRTMRFTLLQLPGRIVRPAGRAVLRIAALATSRQRIREIETRLAA